MEVGRETLTARSAGAVQMFADAWVLHGPGGQVGFLGAGPVTSRLGQ